MGDLGRREIWQGGRSGEMSHLHGSIATRGASARQLQVARRPRRSKLRVAATNDTMEGMCEFRAQWLLGMSRAQWLLGMKQSAMAIGHEQSAMLIKLSGVSSVRCAVAIWREQRAIMQTNMDMASGGVGVRAMRVSWL